MPDNSQFPLLDAGVEQNTADNSGRLRFYCSLRAGIYFAGACLLFSACAVCFCFGSCGFPFGRCGGVLLSCVFVCSEECDPVAVCVWLYYVTVLYYVCSCLLLSLGCVRFLLHILFIPPLARPFGETHHPYICVCVYVFPHRLCRSAFPQKTDATFSIFLLNWWLMPCGKFFNLIGHLPEDGRDHSPRVCRIFHCWKLENGKFFTILNL